MFVKLYDYKHYYYKVEVSKDEMSEDLLRFLEENALKNRNQDVSYAKHNVPLTDEAINKVTVIGPEEIIIQRSIEIKADKMIDDVLTEVQKRRFKLLLEGHTFAQIARLEECTSQSVVESIKFANKKLRKYLNDDIDNL